MASNELHQVSIISALMDGVASSGVPISTLLDHGDHGLGTFRRMAGELIMLDGAIYQMKSDGTVTAIDTSPSALAPDGQPIVAPFAMVTRFRPTVRDPAAHLPSKAALSGRLSELLPEARNLYVAFRADGAFRSVTVRTAEGQRFEGEPLAALGARQVTHVLERERGTLIGFRSPAFSHGVSVAGDHLHFISEDRKRGGHVLALETGDEDETVVLAAAPIAKVHLELPVGDAQFNEAELKLDSQGIHAVEG